MKTDQVSTIEVKGWGRISRSLQYLNDSRHKTQFVKFVSFVCAWLKESVAGYDWMKRKYMFVEQRHDENYF